MERIFSFEEQEEEKEEGGGLKLGGVTFLEKQQLPRGQLGGREKRGWGGSAFVLKGLNRY